MPLERELRNTGSRPPSDTKRFPHLALKETTVRRIKNAYLLELKSNPRAEPDNETVPELPCKKKGRPLLIGEELDKQVRDYLHVMRKNGTEEQGCKFTCSK